MLLHPRLTKPHAASPAPGACAGPGRARPAGTAAPRPAGHGADTAPRLPNFSIQRLHGQQPDQRHKSPRTTSSQTRFLQEKVFPSYWIYLNPRHFSLWTWALYFSKVYLFIRKGFFKKTGLSISLGFMQHPSCPQHLIQCFTKGPRGWTNIAPGKTQCERDLYVHVWGPSANSSMCYWHITVQTAKSFSK